MLYVYSWSLGKVGSYALTQTQIRYYVSEIRILVWTHRFDQQAGQM